MIDKDLVFDYQDALFVLIKDNNKGISQDSIAAAIGVSRNSVNAYMNRRTIMKLDVMLSLVFTYNINLQLVKALLMVKMGMDGLESIMNELFNEDDDS